MYLITALTLLIASSMNYIIRKTIYVMIDNPITPNIIQPMKNLFSASKTPT